MHGLKFLWLRKILTHLWNWHCRVPDTSNKLNIYMFLRELKWKSETTHLTYRFKIPEMLIFKQCFQTWATILSNNKWCILSVNPAHSSNWSGNWGPDSGLVCGESPVQEWTASASVPRGEPHFFVNWYASYMPFTWQTVSL